MTPAPAPEAAAPEPPTPVNGFVREFRMLDVTMPNGQKAELDAFVTRPVEPGRFPLALLTHGAPRDSSTRPSMSPTGYAQHALWFARHGYAAAAVMRRAYGLSPGPYEESNGDCDDRNYLRSPPASAEDLLAAPEAPRRAAR